MTTERFIQTMDRIEQYLLSLREDGVSELPGTAFEPSPATAQKPLQTEPARFACNPERPSPAKTTLAKIADTIAACLLCQLRSSRTRTVPGQGCPNPQLVFVGEAPGLEEDRSGRAFVGPAGEMLSRIIAAMGLTRDDVFITNILKCRPPLDRHPLPGEVTACMQHLRAQLEVLSPQVIVALGPTAAAAMAGQNSAHVFVPGAWGKLGKAEVLSTYHPAYLLTHPQAKAQVWNDMKTTLAKLGRPVPETTERRRKR